MAGAHVRGVAPGGALVPSLAGLVTGLALAMAVGWLGLSDARAVTCTTNLESPRGAGDNVYTDADGRSTTVDLQAGKDYADMRDCHDTVYGGQDADEIHGAYGNDNIFGEGGLDRAANGGKLFGGGGNDHVEGGLGADDLDDSLVGSDVDELWGLEDDDVINGNDGDTSDDIRGNSGTDACSADSAGEKMGCEA